LGFIALPVGTSDPVQRLKLIEEHHKSLSDSRVASQLYYALGIIGVFPNFLIKLTMRYMGLSGLVTNFPFTLPGLSYDGHVVEHMMAAHGIFPRNFGKISRV